MAEQTINANAVLVRYKCTMPSPVPAVTEVYNTASATYLTADNATLDSVNRSVYSSNNAHFVHFIHKQNDKKPQNRNKMSTDNVLRAAMKHKLTYKTL